MQAISEIAPCMVKGLKGTHQLGVGGEQNRLMQSKKNPTDDPAENPSREGWLVSPEQQKVVQFKPDAPTAHGQWVVLRTFHWRPPDYPIPETRRRMLRHNAIEAWETMLKTGWRKCSPPVR